MASDLRLSGLASGADTQAIIDAMMRVNRAPLSSLEARKDKLNFEKEAIRSVNLYLDALRTSLTSLKLESTFLRKSVDSANPDVVTATAATNAIPGDVMLSNITLATATKVTSLAVLNSNADTAAVKESSAAVVTGSGYGNSGVLDTSQTFDTAGFDGQINHGTITINGVAFIIDPDVTTVDDFLGAVNNSEADVTITYSAADDKFTLTSKTTGSNASISISDTNTNFFTEANITLTTTSYGAGTINADKTLSSQTFAPTGLTSESSLIAFKINDVPFSFNIYDYTLNEVMSAINSSDAGVTISYDSLSDKITLTNEATGDKTIALEDVKGNFLDVLNVLDVTRGNITPAADGGNVSDATIAATLRSNTAANDTYTITFNAGGSSYNIVRASDSATIASNISYTSGTSNRLNIDGVTFAITDGTSAPAAGDIFTVIVAANPNPTPNAAAYHAGTNASVDWNGITITPESNEFTYNNLTVNLKQDYSSGNILLKVVNDTETAKTAINDFVTKYNNLVTLLQPAELNDDQKAYLPALTEDDKDKMTAAEIDDYNSYNKLYNIMDIIRADNSLSRLKTSLRRELFNPVNGLTTQYDRLTDIGLSTGSIGISVEEAKKGLLQVDTDTLDAALQNDPDAVMKLFANNSVATTATDEDGVARKLITQVNSAISYNGYLQRRIVSGGSIDQQIASLDDTILRFESRMSMVENRLITRFAYMETMLSNLKDQSSWLAGQISKL